MLQIKDRHNGNIMVDDEGHLIYIDFGFCLTLSPGNIGFENAPFKFNQEYLEVIGEIESSEFFYFKMQIIKGFKAFRKHYEEIIYILEIWKNLEIPCFNNFDLNVFKERFHINLSDIQREQLVNNLIYTALNSTRTLMYDQFQKYTNNIEY